MRIVSYADEHFNTTDAVAEKLLQYSIALTQSGRSDVVRIPVVANGSSTWVQLVMGPGTQLTALEVHQDETQLQDADVLVELDEKIRRETHPGSPVGPEAGGYADSDGWLSDV
ncbi:MAG: hypothetical protein JWR33_680 [Naasia sp.]|jgi:hypothetical protein|uniref:hypothetical protein n=1 Tax=Naasia sp. TaxID=2546198 RepID=UPI002629DBCE|nr:hypothetical protein [Naasia sp.]MCU1569939.1 hypothetical protein [Naasia sp.]